MTTTRTKITETGVEQTVDFLGDATTLSVNVQAQQMEAGIRLKLIELGWTPPRDPQMTTNDVPLPEPENFIEVRAYSGSIGAHIVRAPVYTADELRAYGDERVRAAIARIAELEAKLAEAERNARRWRAWRNMAGFSTWHGGVLVSAELDFEISSGTLEECRNNYEAAIDAAIAAGGMEGV